MTDQVGCTVAELLTEIGAELGSGGGEQVGARRLTRLIDAGMLASEGVAADDCLCVMSPREASMGPPASPPGLLLVPPATSWLADYPGAAAEVPDARLALAIASRRFARPHLPPRGVHPDATVHPSARLGAGVRVAAGAVIGDLAVLDDDGSVGEGAVVGAGARLGAGCTVHPNAVLYPGVKLGRRVIVHAGAVIGADGFGYAASPGGAVKVHHLGGVVLEDDVEVGANSCIDRGTIQDTVVGRRTKIDNHCQVGHNVIIGSDTLIAAMAGIGGSTTIGSGVILGGYVAVTDHVTIGDGARVAGRSGVTKDVPAGATWAGFPARPHRQFVRELYLLGKLEELWRRAKAGEGSE
ncbi:MAG TPA: UDP-3-O-(3-hydroxymyristoyl)glucosamine N-acyltransferase [Trueperaceae bacterium]|nr:UDP-3-O-(3-hydroxymyristoyl)glucosamine N-acyltransferase [Trueperaceae bacterium]